MLNESTVELDSEVMELEAGTIVYFDKFLNEWTPIINSAEVK